MPIASFYDTWWSNHPSVCSMDYGVFALATSRRFTVVHIIIVDASDSCQPWAINLPPFKMRFQHSSHFNFSAKSNSFDFNSIFVCIFIRYHLFRKGLTSRRFSSLCSKSYLIENIKTGAMLWLQQFSIAIGKHAVHTFGGARAKFSTLEMSCAHKLDKHTTSDNLFWFVSTTTENLSKW